MALRIREVLIHLQVNVFVRVDIIVPYLIHLNVYNVLVNVLNVPAQLVVRDV